VFEYFINGLGRGAEAFERDVFLRQLFMIEVFEFGGWFKFSRDGFFLKNHTPPDLLI
jgi:hypothetical protein